MTLEAEESGRYGAQRAFGNILSVKEDVREAWGWSRLEQFARDAGSGLRQVRRNPLFSGLAIATLALGIGGITAIFSVFDAVLIRPLPYADADRLVMIWDHMAKTDVTSRHTPHQRSGSSGGGSTPYSATLRVASREPLHCRAMANPNNFPRER